MVVWVGGLAGLGNHDYILIYIYIDIDSSKLMMFLSCLLGHLIILFGALVHPKLISLI